jgi:hypothetical protein
MFDTATILGAVAFIIGNIAITFATIAYAFNLFESKQKSADPFDTLKNGLLTFALTLIYSEQIDDHNFDYDSYNGRMLPPLSGCDPVNACMSYIVDSGNPHIHAKYNAIQRFLHLNLQNEYAQEQFMEEFMAILSSMNGADEIDEEEQIPIEEDEEDSNKQKEE